MTVHTHYDICYLCKENPNQIFYDRKRSYAAYSGVAREIILKSKNVSCNAAFDLIARWVQSVIPKDVIQGVDFIVPIPSHWARVLFRGHDSVFAISLALSKYTDIRLNSALGVRYTSKQKGKSAEGRAKNISNKFYVRNSVETKNILLVDDVCASGATINEASRVLKMHGAKAVYACSGCVSEKFV